FYGERSTCCWLRIRIPTRTWTPPRWGIVRRVRSLTRGHGFLIAGCVFGLWVLLGASVLAFGLFRTLSSAYRNLASTSHSYLVVKLLEGPHNAIVFRLKADDGTTGELTIHRNDEFWRAWREIHQGETIRLCGEPGPAILSARPGAFLRPCRDDGRILK
ncbi:MAG: hypothetical protein ACREDR_06410, partial [Blastocatellia bacterium]